MFDSIRSRSRRVVPFLSCFWSRISFVSVLLIGLAGPVASAAPREGAGLCGIPDPLPSSVKCHLPRDCGSGASIEVGKFQVGVGGDTARFEECCRVLEWIPGHNTKKDTPEYELVETSVSGWTRVGECAPGSFSILGIISIPLGSRYCDYGDAVETSIPSYESNGYCGSSPRP